MKTTTRVLLHLHQYGETRSDVLRVVCQCKPSTLYHLRRKRLIKRTSPRGCNERRPGVWKITSSGSWLLRRTQEAP